MDQAVVETPAAWKHPSAAKLTHRLGDHALDVCPCCHIARGHSTCPPAASASSEVAMVPKLTSG
jgi:hypothetical protein